eukprot:TRINITY_DN22476_c0_g1_i2.p1 TRINITY_DN22476_c0_g1~~TRINITY_DN22476_c0_g1_i2.p1  ORF type:complete len:1603 (-),score=411.41 TRINITY_DN22476_c0_g1_i2:295-5103(-)
MSSRPGTATQVGIPVAAPFGRAGGPRPESGFGLRNDFKSALFALGGADPPMLVGSRPGSAATFDKNGDYGGGLSSLPGGRLPGLGKRLQGCWSAPQLTPQSRSGSNKVGEYSFAGLECQSPVVSTFAVAAGQQKAQANADAIIEQRMKRMQEKSSGNGGQQRVKNSSVWQRWQVSMPSHRLVREEVLERDRERQRSLLGWSENRTFGASPARSHCASLFFSQVPGGESVADNLPPSFRTVARPDSQDVIQCLETRTATSSRAGIITEKRSMTGGETKPDPKEVAQDEITRHADLVFTGEQMNDVINVVEAFANLVKAPIREVDILAGGTEPNLAPGQRLDIATVREHERQGPMMLRPIFCRFLLSTKLCGLGGADSPYRFDELVRAFDEQAGVFGVFNAMTRSLLVGVLAKILVPSVAIETTDTSPKKKEKEGDQFEDPARQAQRSKEAKAAAEEKARQKEAAERAAEKALDQFFGSGVPEASAHSEARYKRLKLVKHKVMPVEENEVPAPVLAECALENLWPPLPPRGSEPQQIADWNGGVRQWKAHVSSQNPAHLQQLRAHTESVVRGEVLVAQLLEPEVLHFTTRFLPLFRSIFAAYADWPDPEPPVKGGLESDKRSSQVLGAMIANKRHTPAVLKHDQLGIGLGHMSFAAFFRFCIDFGLFSKHASFEEVKTIYDDAELRRRVNKRKPSSEMGLPTISVSVPSISVEEAQDMEAMGSKGGKTAKRKSMNQMSPQSLTSPTSSGPERSKLGSRLGPPGEGGDGDGAKRKSPRGNRASILRVADPDEEHLRPPACLDLPDVDAPRRSASKQSVAAKPRMSKKLVLLQSKAETATIAEAYAFVPHIDLRFFDKPMASMNMLEIKLVTLFASIAEWLSERFQRLADITQIGGMPKAEVRELRRRQQTAAAKATMLGAGLDPATGDFLQDADPDMKIPQFRNKDEHDVALRSAIRSVKQAVEMVMEDVREEKCMTPQGFLDNLCQVKTAYWPEREEMEAMYKLLTANYEPDDGAAPKQNPPKKGKSSAILVFELDKVLCKAREVMNKARRWSCVAMRLDDECSPKEKVVVNFFREVIDKMYESALWMDGEVPDFLSDCNQVDAELLYDKARQLGIEEDKFPPPEALADVLDEAMGRREGGIGKSAVYRILAMVQEGKSVQRQQDCTAHMLRCLTRHSSEIEAPTDELFGLSAFVECVVKLALHRLGFKGLSTIQRGSPAWWKCTWLLTLLLGSFNEQVKRQRFDGRIVALAMEGEGSWEDAFSDTLGVRPPRMHPISSFVERTKGNSRHSAEQASDCGSEGGDSSSRSPSRSGARKRTPSRPGSIGKTTPRPQSPRSSKSGARVPGAGASEAGSDGTQLTSLTRKSGAARRRAQASKEVVIDKGVNQDAEIWWRKVKSGILTGRLASNIAPLEWLVDKNPDLFEPDKAEVQINTHLRGRDNRAPKQTTDLNGGFLSPGSPSVMGRGFSTASDGGYGKYAEEASKKCAECGESPSFSGWGNPSCSTCNCVEMECFPFEKNVVGGLLETADRYKTAFERYEEEEAEAMAEAELAKARAEAEAAKAAKAAAKAENEREDSKLSQRGGSPNEAVGKRRSKNTKASIK